MTGGCDAAPTPCGLGPPPASGRIRVVPEDFRVDEVLGFDLARLCFEGPESTLVQTENVQPAITLINLACLEVLKQEGFAPAAVTEVERQR